MGPVFLAMAVLVGAALVVAVLQNKNKAKQAAAAAAQPAADEPQKSNPFADRDNDPRRRDGSKIGSGNTAPKGLNQTPLWLDAKAKADKGMALVKEAITARSNGDEETYKKKGLEGQELLNEALEATGDWLLALLEEHPDDRQVDGIGYTRGRWGKSYEKVRFLE